MIETKGENMLPTMHLKQTSELFSNQFSQVVIRRLHRENLERTAPRCKGMRVVPKETSHELRVPLIVWKRPENSFRYTSTSQWKSILGSNAICSLMTEKSIWYSLKWLKLVPRSGRSEILEKSSVLYRIHLVFRGYNSWLKKNDQLLIIINKWRTESIITKISE